jgi:hypothetical protein
MQGRRRNGHGSLAWGLVLYVKVSSLMLNHPKIQFLEEDALSRREDEECQGILKEKDKILKRCSGKMAVI